MGVLQRFERRVESLVNGAFAKAFKAEVQPVELASALARECDDRAAIVARGRTMVPNAFTICLGNHDFDRLSVYAGPLGDELAELVREHAKEQGYSFLGPVTVVLEHADNLETGRFRVRSAAQVGVVADPAHEVTSARSSPWLEIGATTYALTSPATVIGRGSDADLRVPDPGISRRHAEIRLRGLDAVIFDLGSTNGVLVDGQRVDRAELRDGARVQLGSTGLTFHRGR